MKGKHSNSLVARLNRLKTDLEAIGNPESRAAFLRELDDLIARLWDVRTQLTSAPLESRLSQIQSPLGQVIEFLEFAKADTSLAPLIFDALNHKVAKPKRLPVDIPADLTNERIRELVASNLSRQELKAIAAQRGISADKLSNDEVKRAILRSLEQQEGYRRLALP